MITSMIMLVMRTATWMMVAMFLGRVSQRPCCNSTWLWPSRSTASALDMCAPATLPSSDVSSSYLFALSVMLAVKEKGRIVWARETIQARHECGTSLVVSFSHRVGAHHFQTALPLCRTMAASKCSNALLIRSVRNAILRGYEQLQDVTRTITRRVQCSPSTSLQYVSRVRLHRHHATENRYLVQI